MKYLTLPVKPLVRKGLLLFLVAAILIVVPFTFVLHYLYTPIPALTMPVTYEVAAGSSLSQVTRDLAQAGYLEYPRLVNWLARWRGEEGAIKTGEYELQAGLSPEQLLKELVLGNARQYRLTLVEGWTVQQALEAIWASARVKRRLNQYDPAELTKLLQIDGEVPEGMLFPDTYFYTAGTTDLQILQRAHAKLNEVLLDAWEHRLGALPYASPYEALILASIIEKESAFGAERGHIAGVFVRRLELGMRLQSDPTVIYGLGDAFDGNLTRTHLNAPTAYNTYRIPALPPSPIALAGRESIKASLHPLPSNYLYFVAKGNGEHHFSTSLEEHNAAVRQYQSAEAND